MSDINGSTSDGYHTFDELYDHRITLFIALCRVINHRCGGRVWRCIPKDTTFAGWFLLGLDKKAGEQITYHVPMQRWYETDFAEEYQDNPLGFDGHTSADVLVRLKAVQP